jgi:putative component of membrane protein insertase Oxa1/YidC/SpoIIIJ protein YidD
MRAPSGVRSAAARPAALAAALAAAAVTAGCASDPADDAADSAIGFYQRVLGDQWAWHCDFQPSCSEFGRQAVAEQGALLGAVMTADRLQRDHHYEHDEYPADEYGRPVDPPRASALFGPRVEEEPRAEDRELAAALEATPPLIVEEAAQVAFADSLFERGEWAAARIEYERLLHARPGSKLAVRCRERAAICLAKARRRGDALAHLARIDDAAERAAARALVERELGRPHSALAAAEKAGSPLLSGFLALEADLAEEARAEFARLGQEGVERELSARIDSIERLPRKSPALAGSLSAVLPGAGQLYVGRPGDALVAFMTNGLLIGGTVSAARRDQDAAAIALGVVASGFWFGNIYGAANGAASDFRERRDAELDRARGWLRQSGVFAAPTTDGRGGALGLYFGF